MNARTYALSLTISLICGLVLAENQTNSIRWAPDLISAREASTKFNVPLMIHFYGDGCLPCRTLEQRVFTQPEVIGSLNRYFICVAINGTTQPNVAAEFAVHSWPTDVFIAPDGETLYHGVSPQDVRNYIGILTNVAVMNRDRIQLLASSKADSLATGRPQPQHFEGSQLDTLKASHPDLAALPGLGTKSASVTSTPNFYATSGQPAASQQLAQSVSPRADVQSGPAIPAHQPRSISNSANPVPTQISQPVTAGIPSGQVPNGQFAASQFKQDSSLPFPDLPSLQAASMPDQLADRKASMLDASGLPSLETETTGLKKQDTIAQAVKGNTNPFQLTSSINNPESQAQATDTPNSQAVSDRASLESEIHGTAEVETVALEQERPHLDGYCPVALHQQQWSSGNPEFSVKHRGKIYWLSSPEAVESFLKNPDDFVPALSGYDPQILLSQGQLVLGTTQHGLFEANTGQVLLFSSQGSKDQFQSDFEKNMRALNALRQRLAAGPTETVR